MRVAWEQEVAMDLTLARRPVIWFFVATLVMGAMVAISSAWAQEGVAGMPPVFSEPQKETPREGLVGRDDADIRVQSALVITPVTVVDSSGEFVYDLKENEFQILDNGLPQRIERFENLARPIAAVIVVQTNRNVAPALDHVRPLGPLFSALMLGPQGKAAVVTYDDRVRVALDFTDDSDRLGETLRDLKPQGDQSRLNDALMRAIAMLEKRPRTERRVIVAIADGYDGGSETGDEEVVRGATGAETTIYGLGFNPAQLLLAKKPEAPPPSPLDTNVARPLPPGTAPTPTRAENTYGAPIPVVDILVATGQIIRSAAASSLLEFYAGYTGGVFFTHWKKKTLEGQLSRVAAEVNSQYELAYVPATLNQPGFHRIEVQVQRPGVKVRARAGYFYQPPKP